MTKQERERYREYVQNWKRVGALLERIRIRELRSPDYGKDWRIIDGLCELAMYHRRPRLTSGLIEQQRLFAKARR
jgi:hypothetical protein